MTTNSHWRGCRSCCRRRCSPQIPVRRCSTPTAQLGSTVALFPSRRHSFGRSGADESRFRRQHQGAKYQCVGLVRFTRPVPRRRRKARTRRDEFWNFQERAARIGGLRVVPGSASWTESEVRDIDGAVKIVARNGDLTLIDADGTTTLHQGPETTRDETQEKGKKKRDRGAGAVPAAGDGILDIPVAIGAGAVGGLTARVLLRSDELISPNDPR